MSHYLNKMALSARDFESIQAIVEQAIAGRTTAFGWVRGRFYKAYPGGRIIDHTETVSPSHCNRQ